MTGFLSGALCAVGIVFVVIIGWAISALFYIWRHW